MFDTMLMYRRLSIYTHLAAPNAKSNDLYHALHSSRRQRAREDDRRARRVHRRPYPQDARAGPRGMRAGVERLYLRGAFGCERV